MAIVSYIEENTDSNNVRKIDSIQILSTDTLTQKNSEKITLDRYYKLLRSYNDIYDSKLALIKADSALLWSFQQQKVLYDKHGEKYDDNSLKAQEVKMVGDTTELKLSAVNVRTAKYLIDSLSKVFVTVDSVSLFEYYVNAVVYFHGVSSEQGVFIISKDWKARH